MKKAHVHSHIMLGNDLFDEKLQEHWALAFFTSFSCGRNCRTFVENNCLLPLSEKELQKTIPNNTCLFRTIFLEVKPQDPPTFLFLALLLPLIEIAGPLLKAIRSSFSLKRHFSSEIFFSNIVIFR